MRAMDLVQAEKAKKSLGQHFLRDESVVRRIAALLQAEKGDQILEIGPGPGALTAMLRPLPWRRLVLIEKDDYYAGEHRRLALPGMEVISGDAMLHPWQQMQGLWIITGNLPYNIASPLMWDIVSRTPGLKRAVFMIQKEVAERILAPAGSKSYGALSVWIQSYCTAAKGFIVPPSCFSPPPKVDSEVIVLMPIESQRRPAQPERLSSLLKICFQQRRKQLQAILRKRFSENAVLSALERAGVDPSQRPETLLPHQFHALADLLF
ncbi:MAG: ribosomal RNA small subunit methyltransferase A [Mailhella sp.]|nr:ribosomal RNA small subunit methyltransferase A [Mailhella sp.]